MALAGALGSLVPPSGAVAQTWHLGVEAGTDFPVAVRGRISLEMPGRLLFSTSLGVLPGAYADSIGWFVLHLNGLPPDTANLFPVTFRSSLVWRSQVGWRPFGRLGFYFEIGYGLVTLGGGFSEEGLLATLTGVPPPPLEAADAVYHLSSTLHMFDVEVGWRWVFRERLVVRVSLGYAGTVGSSTAVKPRFVPADPSAVATFSNLVQKFVDNVFTSGGHTPVFSVGIGYRFF